ncbi:MAG: AIPR family protein [Alphaproteobacteria bacterium GM202ARS2]|nr:AIPR family protein [Alphaproteobacteria bacterium GM202ARS2]
MNKEINIKVLDHHFFTLPSVAYAETKRCVATVALADIPDGIGIKPNVRTQNINKTLYKSIRKETIDSADTDKKLFYLKNKGITIVAEEVKVLESKDNKATLRLSLQPEHGIVDGGHTYKIITSLAKEDPSILEGQYVTVDIRTGLDSSATVHMAHGMNTSTQVKTVSLLNAQGVFEPIKEQLRGTQGYSGIAWSENETGKHKASDIIAFMTLFNHEWPQKLTVIHRSLGKVENFYKEEYDKSYRPIFLILKDILQLRDRILLDAPAIWRAGGKRTKEADEPKKSIWKKCTKNRLDKGTFIEDETAWNPDWQLTDNRAILYPLMWAFHYLLHRDSQSHLAWKPGSFDGVLQVWQKVGFALLSAYEERFNAQERKYSNVVRDKLFWKELYRIVEEKSGY